jgi:subtilisin
MTGNHDFSRRRVLQTVGAGVGTAGVASSVSGQRRGFSEHIVGLKQTADVSAATSLATEVVNTLEFDSIGSAVVGEFSDEALETLRNSSAVRYVEENGEMRALGVAADQEFSAQAQDVPYGIDLTGATDAQAGGVTGDGITVAVVDTGIDPSHEDLEANIVGGYATDEAECSDNCEEPWADDQGHGTHVSGTVGAVDNDTGVVGVAPGVDLLGVKVLGGDGSGSFAGVAEGIEWAVDNGADVLNMSLGGDSQTDVVKDALQYAQDNGVVPVAAAGNSGPCSDCVGYPGAEPEAIAVSSTNESDDLSFFSSTGPEVDIAAPGSNVQSTYPDDSYNSLNGTSMACPHVAGAAASVLSVGTSPEFVRLALKTNAEDIGLGANEQGAGRLDVDAATDGPFEPAPIEVSTGSASGIGENSATLSGSIANLDGASSADVFFEYGVAGSGLSETVDAGTAGEGDSFSADLSGLESNTSYEFVAVASTGGNTGEGNVASFETDGGFEFCFITTATADETETLDSLRRFRDDSMTATPVGKGLVGLYYRISPPIARTLDRHPDSPEAGLTRSVIEASASLSDSQEETDSRVKSATLGVMLTMLYLVGLVVGAAGHVSLRTRETLSR